jgi:hypothetical protein
MSVRSLTKLGKIASCFDESARAYATLSSSLIQIKTQIRIRTTDLGGVVEIGLGRRGSGSFGVNICGRGIICVIRFCRSVRI